MGINTNSAELGDELKFSTTKDGGHVKSKAESGSSGLEESGDLL